MCKIKRFNNLNRILVEGNDFSLDAVIEVVRAHVLAL